MRLLLFMAAAWIPLPSLRRATVCVALACPTVLGFSEASAQTVTIPPAPTFLRTNGETVPGTTPIILSALNLRPGDVVLLERLGDFRPGPQFTDASRGMIAVFSASATLLASTNLNRVQDAIDAGLDVTTAATYYSSLPTDILQDFQIFDATVVTVPEGATHLFVAASDSLYHDNDDPDKDFATRITRLPTPAALRIWGGLQPASAADKADLDVVTDDAPPPGINLLDAVRLARRAAGTD